MGLKSYIKSLSFIKTGVTRIVILCGKYVIKIPNCSNCHLHFLHGCYANWSERFQTKQHVGISDYGDTIVPSIFCSWFGLIQIMERAASVEENYYYYCNADLLKKQGHSDIKPTNVGWHKEKIKMVDYG